MLSSQLQSAIKKSLALAVAIVAGNLAWNHTVYEKKAKADPACPDAASQGLRPVSADNQDDLIAVGRQLNVAEFVNPTPVLNYPTAPVAAQAQPTYSIPYTFCTTPGDTNPNCVHFKNFSWTGTPLEDIDPTFRASCMTMNTFPYYMYCQPSAPVLPQGVTLTQVSPSVFMQQWLQGPGGF